MTSQVKPPKDLVETPEFEKSRKKISSDPKLFDDVMVGVTFVIAKDPNLFPFIPNTKIQIAKTDKSDRLPGLTFYFKEYDNKVVLLDVEISPEE